MLAAELLAQARRRGGLSQRQLARSAGTSQAMVARIEAGRQSPSVTTLSRLVHACGFQLSIGLVDAEMPHTTTGSPAGERVAPVQTGGRALRCVVGGEQFALPLDSVREVTPYAVPRRLPGQPAWMAGVVVVRGDALPAIDAAGQLGLQPGGEPEAMAVLDVGAGFAALIVDRVTGIVDVSSEAVPLPPWTVGAGGHVAGIADLDGGLVVILRPAAFLSGLQRGA